MEMDSDDGLSLNTDLKVTTFEELYSTMEDLSPDNSDSNCICQMDVQSPSCVSLGSWSFSPINALDDSDKSLILSANDINTETGQIDTDLNSTEPNNDVSKPNIMNSDNDVDYHPSKEDNGGQSSDSYFSPVQQHPQSQTHTVQTYQPQIQNYITNYCISPPWQELYSWSPPWQDVCAWNTPPSIGILTQTPKLPLNQRACNVNNNVLHRDFQKLEPTESMDPFATLNTQSLDLTRCSTPEYLMALNSLHQQPDIETHTRSPLDHQTDTVNINQNYPQSSLKTFPLPRTVNSSSTETVGLQDSGYNSDLNSSPVIGYQDGTADNRQKVLGNRGNRGQQTSTPQNHPIMRLATFNCSRENIPPNPHRIVSRRIPMPGFIMNQTNQNACLPNSVINHLPSDTLQPLKQRPNDIQSSAVTSSHLAKTVKPNFLTLADYEESRRSARAVLKRKAESMQKTEPFMKSEKRRRHNEPLDLQAVEVLTNWYESHKGNPYPTKVEKERMSRESGLTMAQVKSWFANKRNRSNNTRPKKQKQVMADKLLDLCHQLARDAKYPDKDNAYYIQQLSGIIGSSSTGN